MELQRYRVVESWMHQVQVKLWNKQLLLHLLYMFFYLFIPQFDYVPDASMIQRRGTSAMPLVSFNTATFHGVHKTLEMKQCLDHSGQPTFITNSSYCVKGRHTISIL